MDPETLQVNGPNPNSNPRVRDGHGAAARLALADAERFFESANRALGDEMTQQALSHLTAAFEGSHADERSTSAMSFREAGGAPAADD
ncbi:hypothetical protein ACFQE1_11330 [Halobium palmae]|uniref:Uncharacterized protein n=1 Tax=Halobium palmae TaxID=1776492 RepID=A0ABD5S125_9EURY